jgi:alpha-tubulin suppressor-like RCC1 family protein
MQDLLKTQQFVKFIACGSHHNVVVTIEGELYSWGSNKNNCLGRQVLRYLASNMSPPRCKVVITCVGDLYYACAC